MNPNYRLLAIIFVVCTSCVSQGKYDNAINEANYWERNHSELYTNFYQLQTKYNELEENYKKIEERYTLLEEISNECCGIDSVIDEAKHYVTLLKMHLSNEQDAFLKIYLTNIEETLDQWRPSYSYQNFCKEKRQKELIDLARAKSKDDSINIRELFLSTQPTEVIRYEK